MNLAADEKVLDFSIDFYSCSPGNLGTRASNGLGGWSCQWDTCRETFHGRYDIAKTASGGGYCYCLGTGQTPNLIPEMLFQVEDILRIPVDQRTRFYKVKDQKTLLWVEPGSFWTAQMMRHQFMSCVLRAGLAYTGNNFWEALLSYKYLISTWRCALRFLDGNTWHTGLTCAQGSDGWVARMAIPGGQDAGEWAKKQLIKPPT